MSCADVQTIQAGNGTKTQFSFDFPYIFKSEIHVYFWNATTKEWDEKLTTDATYPWQVTDANPTIVEFTSTAPPAPAVPVDPGESSVDNVRIRRITNIDDIRALFNPGSAIRSDDLNRNFEQLRYAIQESNCQGITDDMYQYLLANYWDRFDNTLYSADTWRSDDATIATTAALDQRFQDEVTDTLTKAELAANSNVMPDNDNAVPTTGALNDYIDEVITNDIGTDGTGITVTDDGDGTITLGLADNTIDLSKIKNEDIVTYAEQEAGSPSWDSDNRIPTTYAASRRFDTLVQTATPTGSNWEVGKTWLQNTQDLTLSIWNGSAWLGIASGGTFTNQPKVVYVDASSGDDNNDGHRISRPKATIKAAINQINADATYGDGSVVVVAPGVYQEAAPIDILKKDVSIIGTALRSCIIHPTQATETNSLFRVNSGTFLQNLTFTGVKASGTRGEVGSIDPDAVYGLPGTQGWNVSFYPGAMIYKSPYIQNCTNFSDSEINNSSLNPHTPAGGSAGDTDSAPTGGGLLVDGSVVDSSSPLRSMVCDSYTHVGLDGPGILVTNNGYAQCTSSYAFFNHYHIKCVNGGQANLAASTTDFGRYGLVADGRSTNAIFTATTTVAADDGDISFTIGTPVAGSPWHGSATRPQSNMLVDIGGNTYPILSATPNGTGWDVVISRTSSADRSVNLGLDGAVASGSSVSFYLRSMIASSGHTMEYVGSGTNYSALPENGGVPVEANQVVELNNGKIWTATTDHNGKFKVGNFFTVDQQTNAIFISSGSFNVDLQNLQVNPSGNAVIGANLDLNGSDILDSTGNVTIADTLDMNSNQIINVSAPSSGNHATTKDYVDNADSLKVDVAGDTMTGALGIIAGSASSPSVFISGDTNTGIYSPGADQVAISTNGTQRATIDSSGRLLVGTPTSAAYGSSTAQLQISGSNENTSSLSLHRTNGSPYLTLNTGATSGTAGNILFQGYDGTSAYVPLAQIGGVWDGTGGVGDGPGRLVFSTTADGSSSPTERLRITSDGKVGVGTSAPGNLLHVESSFSGTLVKIKNNAGSTSADAALEIESSTTAAKTLLVKNAGTERFYVKGNGDSYFNGSVGIGTTSPAQQDGNSNPVVHLYAASSPVEFRAQRGDGCDAFFTARSQELQIGTNTNHRIEFRTDDTERARIDTSGRLLVGTSSNSENVIAAFQGFQGSSTGQGIIAIKRGSTPSSGNTVAQIRFNGPGTDEECAYITATADGTWGSGDYPGRLVFSTTADGASSPTERMRIENNGDTGLGKSGSDVTVNIIRTGSGDRFRVNANASDLSGGYFYYNASNNYGTISDSRLKSNIEIASTSDDTVFIQNIIPHTFSFGDGAKQLGFIAQNVLEATQNDAQKVAVANSDSYDASDPDCPFLGVSVTPIVAALVNAYKTSLARIETLEAKVAALEAS